MMWLLILVTLAVSSLTFAMDSTKKQFQRITLEAGFSLHADLLLLEKDLSFSPPGKGVLFCSMFCAEEPGCLTFALPLSKCRLYSGSSRIMNSSELEDRTYYSQIKSDVLVLRQDVVGAGGTFFPAFSGAWDLNKGNPGAPNYSILDELQDFVGHDGIFHFRLCYPNLPDVGNDKCFIFQQESDPRSEPISGFVWHHHPPGFGPTMDCPFTGLVSDTQAHAWMDGYSEPTGGWFPFALGSPTYWLTPGLFPGPCKQLDANSNNGQLTRTDHVELFVMEMF